MPEASHDQLEQQQMDLLAMSEQSLSLPSKAMQILM